MVRETRHLWVGNLPENIREDRIRDHFKRYGRVQSVKLLPRAKDDEGSGVCATVSFMDIKSASKAHNNEQKLEDRALSTEYHEPAAIPGGSAAPIYASPRFSHGPPEEISSFERSSHFYERERERRDGDAYLRRPASTYHVAPTEPLRGRTRDRLYRNGPYTPIIESVVSRQPPHHRSVGSSWSYEAPASRYPTASTTPDVVYPEERREPTAVVVLHKKHTKSRSGSNGSESGSNSGSSGSRSRSSSSSSQSASSSCSSASSSPVSDKSCSTHSHHGSLRSGVTLQSAVSTPHTNNSSPAVHSDDRRPLAICVRNLPARSSDTSLKDGLFHEYKKHGKVTWVKVVGQGAERYALVCFKKPEDVEKALQVSHDKLFFGCKIEVGPYQGYDVDDNEFRPYEKNLSVHRPYEAEQDEFHPKATRTLFIGNLEKDITAPELRKHFDQFGEIIEIDIKKQGSASSYAFCQYCDIGSVVRAMRTLDGEHLGNNRIKLGFGKSMHTNCVWVDGVSESVSEKYLSLQFSQFGPVSHVAIDRSRGHALVFYEQIAFAQMAVKEMRGVALRGRKLQVDFASRECQEAFYDHLEKQTGHTSVFENSVQASPQAIVNAVAATARGFETPSSSSSSSGGGSTRYNATSLRYTPQQPTPRSTALYPRAPSNSGASPGASTPSPSTPIRTTPRHQMTSRFEFTSDYATDRRPYRSYEDVGLDDGGGLVMVTVGQGPPDIRHLQKERNALLEQLEDCASSGEEGGPRRRCKHRRSHSGEGGGGGSRPGTPLCDERPENLPPLEPRRTPRERPPDPLSLPLPRFASQVLSPRPAPPSPPASPPRPQSSSSDDSEPSPPSPEWEERLRSLDEKYEKWSGSRTALTKVDASALRIRHKLLDLDLHELQPSDIVKSVLAKRSVFDEDSKRLENFGEKYEPREFIPSRPGITALRSRLDSSSPLHSPVPKSPASSPAGGAKGLQYPFPSHPPVQPTTSVATTTAAMSLVSCAGVGSLAITTATCTIPSIEISKAPQTFSTSCITTVTTVRQFPLPSLSNYLPPKISPPPPSDKKVETNETSPRGLTISSEKCKSVQKNPSSICIKVEKCDNTKKEVVCSKPLKPCSRRESTEEKKDGDGRRRSREETVEIKSNSLIKEIVSDKVRDTELCERRKSVSDKRRDSVDGSQQDVSESVSVSDKSRDSNHKEERRRRDSVDHSARRDSESSDTCKSRLSELRRDCSSEQSEVFECTRLTGVDSVNKPNERRKDSDDNTRHIANTDLLDKKKETFVTYSERDRRRARDSVDSCSDNSRNRKVPESIDKNKELETDLRHNDISAHEKKDDETKKITEHQDRRKDVVHNDNIRNCEISDRRREKDNCEVNQEIVRHRERKEHPCKKDKEMVEHLENIRHKSNPRKSPEIIENTRHKENDRRKSIIPNDNSRHRDTNIRKDSDSSEDHSQKSVEHKKESDYGFNSRHKDNSRRKESETEFSISLQIKKEIDHQSKREFDHIQSKKECDQSENLRHKDLSHKKDIENQSRRDIDKKRESEYYDNSKQKDNDKPKEPEVINLFQVKEVEIKKECDSFEVKAIDFEIRKDLELGDHSRHKDSEKQLEPIIESCKTKYDERKQDLDGLDVRLKEFDSKKKDCDIIDNPKHRDSENKKDSESLDNIKFWDSERKKDADITESCKSKEHKNSEIKKEPDVDIGKLRDYERRKDLPLQVPENCRHRDDKRKDLENLENAKREEKRRDFEIPDPLRHRENDRKKVDNLENSKYLDRKKDNDISEIFRRKELEKKKDDVIDSLRFRDCERRKELDSQENIRHRDLSEKRRESSDKERRKERESLEGNSEIQRSRESTDERRKDREGEREKLEKSKRSKDYENQDKQKDMQIEGSDKRKENGDNCDRKSFDSIEKRSEISSIEDFERKTELIKKEKRKDRISSSSWPAAIGCKRRLSSQDSLDICIDEAKRVKPERRDSKDSGRSSCSSSKRSSGEKHNKSYTKMLEEKIREDRERELHKKKKEEEINLEDKGIKSLPRKEKRNSSEKRKEERKVKPRPRENGTTASESELGSGDDEGKLSKRHSIFDIVDDEPAYISMYDKVKARSTKNMQKQEEEKRQERLKEKFSQLKQCRAKREEKKRSTSYDEDSDSERGGGRRSNKLMITSSEEDAGSDGDTRTKARKIMSDTSEDDMHRHSIARIKPIRIHSEDIEPKPRKIMSDTSEDDTLRLSISRIKSSRLHSEDLEIKPRKILSDTSEDDMLRHNISRNKTSRIHSDESEVDMGFEDQSKVTEVDSHPKVVNDSVADLFSNVSEDNEQFPDAQPVQTPQSPDPSSFHRNSIDSHVPGCEIPRKKSHKKKQKRQKNCEGGEDGFSNKRHISKKDRRKSTHSRDGEDDGKSSQGKIRKKKSERENAVKRDEKMEDIFGTLSDDSDKGQAKWQVSQVYASDSDSDREVARKRDKRRRERKARELDEAGRALEAKLLETSDNYPQPEEQQVTKTKKKKRKKSRDEKSSKHHQHRLVEEETAGLADSEREPEPPVLQPSLPRLIDSPPPPIPNQNKKPDIPGFGSQVDENIHETAVKSISESPTKIVEEKTKPIEPILPAQSEDKPTPVISQEETEDAVAALLLEDSFGGGFEGYPADETPKPDTPISEPDLQIDTDTEDTFDPIDFSRPPRTPDIPTSFYRQQDTREGLEERILALACPDASSKSEPTKPIETQSNIVNHGSQDLQKEVKTVSVDNNKKVITSLKVQQESTELRNERPRPIKYNDGVSHQTIETGKRHDLPPLIRQNELTHVVHPVKHALTELKTVHLPSEAKLTVSKTQVIEQQPLLKPLVMTATTKPFISTNPPPLTQRKPQFIDNIKATNPPTNVRFTTCLTLKPASVMAPLNVNVQQPLFQSHQIIQQTSSVKQPSPNQQSKLSPLPQQQPKLNPTVIQGSKVNVQHQHQMLKVTPPVQQHSPKVSPSILESPKSSLSPVQQAQNINIQVNSIPHSQLSVPHSQPSIPHSQASNISFAHDRQHIVKSPKPLNINIPQGEKPNASHLSPQQATPHSQPSNYLQNQPSNIHIASKQQNQPTNIHVTPKQQNSLPNIHVIPNQQHKPNTTTQMESLNVSHNQPSNFSYRKTVLGAQHGNNNVPHTEPLKVIVPSEQMKVSELSKVVIPIIEQLKPANEPTKVFLPHSEKSKDVKEHPSNVAYSQQSSVNCIDSKNITNSQPSIVNTQYVSKQLENVRQEVNVPTSLSQTNVVKPQPMELKTSLSHEQKPIQPSPPQKFTLSPIQNCVLPHPQILKPTIPSVRPQTANISAPNVQNIKPSISSVPNKPNATIPSIVQPIKTVISQSVTIPQIPTVPIQQVIQKTNAVPFVKEMIRPPNAPQPQIVHTLRNDMILEKPKVDVSKQQISHVTRNDLFNQVMKPIMSHVIQPTKPNNPVEEAIPLVSIKADTDEIPKKNVMLENHLEPVKIIQVENKITKPIIDEIKPMNAFIQDLTLKAAAAKQTTVMSGKLEDDTKKETLKPIEQVVQQIHKRIRSSNSESKDAEKLNTTEPALVELKEEIKPITEIKTERTSDDETLEDLSKSVVVEKLEANLPIKIEQIEEPKPDESVKEKVLTPVLEIDKPEEESPKVDFKNTSTTVDEPKVDKIIIKKEDTGMCVDAVVTPLTPKMEKSNVFVSPGESSCEPKEQEMATFDKQLDLLCPEIKEEIVSPEETVVNPIRGGRGGRRRKAGGRVGGVVTRRARLNNKTATTNSSATADVYEFRDDSDEESRPRLILTIKSPPEPSIVQTTSPASNTRKSRRLQEKDGSRNTVDDTIEDVIRGTRNSGRRTTRAAAAASATTAVLETRRSPRRKQAHPPFCKDLMNDVKPLPIETPQDVVTSSPVVPTSQPPMTVMATLPSVPQPTTMILKPTPAVPAEPMTLIDPVTGLLIPMRESEEGQYIPVSTDHVRGLPETHDENGEPVEKRMKSSNILPESIISSVPKPTASPVPLVTTAPTPLPVRQGVPVKMPPNCAVVSPLPSKTNPIISKPNNLSELVRPVVQQSKPITPLPTVTKPIVPTRTSTTIVAPTALTKPLSVTPTSMVKPSSGAMISPTGGKPSPLINTPIPLNRVVVPPPLATTNKPVVTQAQATGTTISAVPLNHKTHLLQAVSHRGKMPIAKVPTPLTPKAHILQSIGNVANCGAREGVVGPGTPPPPHHGALLTGSVASPPLRAPHHVSQQPIVTGASSTRVVCKSLLEPLKVEPGAPGNAGCIVVPTPSPQPRGQVMQAGLPVPAYEASLHGVVAELLPNPQWPRQSPPPAHQHPVHQQQQGEVVQHVNYAPHHIQPAHYVHSQLMYQQYLREAALGGYHLPSGVKPGVDIEEGARGAGASPPLELRRGSPHDRTTDSPQVATLYVHGARHLFYEGPHPPPAHRPSQPRIQVSTPPHASQVPPQADSLLMLLQRYPVMWQGLLALKTDQAAVQMHFVFGNPHVARDSLPCNSDGSTPPLRIVQRMRLEQTQVDGVARKMQMDNEHCMLLALPCGRDHMDVLQQSNNLQSGFITYLQQKQAAGIVNIAAPGSKQAAYVVHIFPACDFANESLARIAPDLLHRVADIAHLLIIIATV